MAGRAASQPIPYDQVVALDSPARIGASAPAHGLSVSVPIQAAPDPVPPAIAPNDAAQQPRRIQYAPPPGFDDLEQATTTDFDVVYLGRRLGSFRATLDGSVVLFENPLAIAEAMGDSVTVQEVAALLSSRLPSNTQLVCPAGETIECGALAPGVSGVIVDPSRFRIDLFLAREYLRSQAGEIEYLPPAMSGFSLIQNATLSLSGEAFDGASDFRFGGALDTYASVGQTAAVARTLIDQDRGARAEQMYGQRVWRDHRLAVGMLQSSASATTSLFRFVGAEFGTFTGTQLDRDRFTASPVEVVLPQRARVEIYRGGTLVLARDYDAGLQTINTQGLPSGTYPIQVVVRNGSAIVSEETRIFTKAGDLPPPGKTYYSARFGQRVSNIFDPLDGGSGQTGFFPSVTDDVVAQIMASRRIGRATGVSAGLLSVGSDIYPELGVQTYLGSMRGIANFTLGPGGSYSALGTLSTSFRGVTGFATVRSVRTDDDTLGAFDPGAFQPFFRSEDEYSLNVQTTLLGGSITLRAQQTRSDSFEDRYSYGGIYSRNIGVTPYGNLRLNLDAFVSDRENRIGFTLSLFRRVNPRTFVRADVGAENISGSNSEERNGASPVVAVSTTHMATLGGADLVLTAGAETNQSQDRLYGRAETYSRWGSVDSEVALQRFNEEDPSATVFANVFTGAVYGGGRLHLGMRQPGEAAILFNVARSANVPEQDDADTGMAAVDNDDAVSPSNETEAEAKQETAQRQARRRYVSVGDYRAVVDGQAFDIVGVGRSSALGLPAYGLYEATLEPRGAPPFDIDLSPKRIPLYVGNVVALEWSARHVITVFGRLTQADGQPLRNARVEAGQDVTLTDDNGYFTITAPSDEDVRARRSDGVVCRPISLKNAEVRNAGVELYRLGNVNCDPWIEP